MNDLENYENTYVMGEYVKSDNILIDIERIIENSQRQAYRTVNNLLTQRNWFIGYRIEEEIIGTENRAEYGSEIILKISKELTAKYGKGYKRANLYHCLNFYRMFPRVIDMVSGKSDICLSWSHYRMLIQVADDDASR